MQPNFYHLKCQKSGPESGETICVRTWDQRRKPNIKYFTGWILSTQHQHKERQSVISLNDSFSFRKMVASNTAKRTEVSLKVYTIDIGA